MEGWMRPRELRPGRELEQAHPSPASSLAPPQPLYTAEHSPTRVPPRTEPAGRQLPVHRQDEAPWSRSLQPGSAQSGPPSPRPGSAGCRVATSFCLRDGLQRGAQPGGLRRGRAVPADAAGLSRVVDLPQVVQRLGLGVLEEVSLALPGRGRHRGCPTRAPRTPAAGHWVPHQPPP